MTSFTLSSDDWLTRETQFAAFATGPLLDFWRLREEGEFSGVDGVPIRFVRFRSARHQRVVVVSPGRIESYVKYPEVAYDLFHCGYDVVIVDHRGQGRSGRLLADTHRGHVVNFADYVDDFEQLWQREVESRGYRQRFALAHSMGGAILAQFLQRRPQAFDAAAFCAPMFGIQLPMPGWLADRILDWVETRPAIRDYYAVGTGQWRPLPLCGQRVDPQPRALSAQPALLRRLPRAAGGRADLPLGAGEHPRRPADYRSGRGDNNAAVAFAGR